LTAHPDPLSEKNLKKTFCCCILIEKAISFKSMISTAQYITTLSIRRRRPLGV
jgi:hypothetical protein